MKREGGNSGSSPMKRSRMDTDGNEAELRLLIQSKAAGSVIGKGGHNISKLRAEFQATITVPDCAGPERVLTICHVEQEAVLKVLESLLPNIDDGGSSRGNGGEDCELRMLVHHSQAGCIIGKAGFKIKELREQTGAQIKVFSTCCPNSTDRIVQVVGKASTVLECVKQIMDLLKASPIKGVNDPYDPHNYDDYYAHEYGGYGDSSGPNRGMRTPSRSGGRGQVFGGMMGSRSRGPMGPHHMSRNYTDGPRGSGMSPPRGRGPAPLMPRPVSSNGMGSRDSPPLDVGFAEDSQPQETTQVSIPKELAGSIIGKGGARIRKIRSDSGAGITIDEPLPGSNDRIITITGTSSQIQMAQFLLQQSVRENSGRKF